MDKQTPSILITKTLSEDDQAFLTRSMIRHTICPALSYDMKADLKKVHSLMHQSFDKWVFTSIHAVRSITLELKQHLDKDNQEILVVGAKSAQLLRQLKYTNIDPSINIKELIQKTKWSSVKNILYFRGNHARPELAQFMKQKKMAFQELEVYQTQSLEPLIKQEDYQAILYFSPLSVQSSVKRNNWMKDILAIAIGATTEKALIDLNFKKIQRAEISNLQSMISTFQNQIKLSI